MLLASDEHVRLYFPGAIEVIFISLTVLIQLTDVGHKLHFLRNFPMALAYADLATETVLSLYYCQGVRCKNNMPTVVSLW